MQPVETILISDTVRVQLYPDTDCSNPLENWDHGIQFITLPDPSRTWRDYTEPTSNTYGSVPMLDPGDIESFREWYQDSYSTLAEKRGPSFKTWLDTNTAAWLPITREGYNGTIVQDHDDLARVDAIALVSRAMFRHWHGIPEGKPMPKRYRQRAAESLRAVIDEYNSWATGDVYGYQVERLDPDNCNCDTEDSDHLDDCSGWESTDDSCWGFIGYEYATEEATHAGMLEAGIPIPQVIGSPNTGIRFGQPDHPGYIVSFHNGREMIRPDSPQASPRTVTRHGVVTHGDKTHVCFYLDGNKGEYQPVDMHRLSWESAQRSMKHLAEVSR